MKGHIRQRGKGKDRWWAVIYQGRNANGKPRYRWHKIDGSKPHAERELRRLLYEIDTGVYIEPTKMTLGQYLDRWLLDHAELGLAGTTYDRYVSIVRSHLTPKLGHHILTKLQPTHISSFYAEAQRSGRIDGKGGLSGRTVLQMHRLLHKALKDAMKLGLIARNPVDAVDAPRFERIEMPVLTPDEIVLLMKAAENSPYYAAVLLAIGAGLRRGEALGLRWSDVDLDEGLATVQRSLEQTTKGIGFKSPKSRRPRRIVLPQSVVDGLRRHRADQEGHRLLYGPSYHDGDLICALPNGEAVKPDTFSRSFREFMDTEVKDVKRIRYHDLRHTHASILGSKGIHPKVVSERLGHSSINITLDLYTHLLPSMQEEAARRFDEAISTAPSLTREDH